MSQPTEPTGPKGKLISTAHRDLHAAAAVYDILDDLPEVDRQRVIAWVVEKYPKTALVEPVKHVGSKATASPHGMAAVVFAPKEATA